MEVLKYRKDANSPWQSLIGLKGEQGEAGYTPVKGVDYFTEEEKQEIIDAAAAGGSSGGMTQGAVEALLTQKNYATKGYVDSAIDGLNLDTYAKSQAVADLQYDLVANHYTKTEVDGLLANLPTGEVDLSGYVTNEELTEAINGIVHPTPDLSEYITESELNGKLFATTTYVNQQIAQIQHPTTDLSNYYTKSEVEALIPPSGEEVSY